MIPHSSLGSTYPISAGQVACPAVLDSAAGRGSQVAHAGQLLEPARVMHVSLGTHMGGLEKLLVEFARYADRQRFALCFACLQSRGALATDITDLNWPLVDFDKRPGISPSLIVRLARSMRRQRVQVVHTHNTAAFVYGVLAAMVAGIPRVVHTRHGQRFGASSRETWLFRLLSRRVYRIVCVCQDGQRLSQAEGIAPQRLQIIYNGIDLQRFAYAGSRPLAAAVLVARLSPEKDVASLLRAVPLVLERLRLESPSLPPFRLNIVGDGTERHTLEGLAQELGLASCVNFLGQQSHIAEILAQSSLFVLPSLTEGISLTLLEAMASGLPVVATRVGGTPEVVVHDQTGCLVPPQSPSALARYIYKIYSSPDWAAELGRAGRQRIEHKFSVANMVRAYEQLYCEARGQ